MSNLIKKIREKLGERGVAPEHIGLINNEDYLLNAVASTVSGMIERYVADVLPTKLITVEIETVNGFQKIGLLKVDSSKKLFKLSEHLIFQGYKLADRKVLEQLLAQKAEEIKKLKATLIFSLAQEEEGKDGNKVFPKIFFHCKSGSGINVAKILSKGKGRVAVLL